MRVQISWRAWIGAGVVCLPCFLSTGCQTAGFGGNWLGWMKPKGTTGALASTAPTKPSSVGLPPPSTTVNGSPGAMGAGTNLAGTAGAGANGYHTGPYGMAGQQMAAPTAGYAANAYGAPGAMPNAAGAMPASGGYQSPYQTGGSAVRTADARRPGGTPITNQYATAAPGGATAPGAMGAPGSAPNGGWSAPEGMGRSEPRGAYQLPSYADTSRAGGGWAAPVSAETPNGGAYRPGSTGRNTGVLPAGATSEAAPVGTAYPTTGTAAPAGGYPSSAYPATTPAAPSAGGSVYGGGYNYPTTQAR